ITTVVGLLGTDDVARGPQDLLATVYGLREEGLSAFAFSGGYHVPPRTLTGSVRGDLVFIEALIGLGEVAISDHRSSQPTLDNRRKALFDEALALAAQGCTIDLTAFPVEQGEDGWSAADGLLRYLDSGAPAGHVTVSSDAGGCLPVFDAEGHVCRMGVGESGALLETLNELLRRGVPLERALPAFTSNPAHL